MASAATVVIGLGNPARGDDGIGIAILECLRDTFDIPETVTLLEGSSRKLADVVAQAGRLLLLDAIDLGSAPGTPVRLKGPGVHRYLDQRLSPYQRGVRSALAAADLKRKLPNQVVAIGVQPMPPRPGERLSVAALQGVDQAARLAARQLEAWGFECHPREMHAGAAGIEW